MSYIEKVINDRNGKEKTIRVEVGGAGAISKNPKWRGLEYGWTAEDVAPESQDSTNRQNMQDWVESHDGEVQARQVKIGRVYVPLIYTVGDILAVVQFADKKFPDIIPWLNRSGLKPTFIIEHRVTISGNGRRHSLTPMS